MSDVPSPEINPVGPDVPSTPTPDPSPDIPATTPEEAPGGSPLPDDGRTYDRT